MELARDRKHLPSHLSRTHQQADSYSSKGLLYPPVLAVRHLLSRILDLFVLSLTLNDAGLTAVPGRTDGRCTCLPRSTSRRGARAGGEIDRPSWSDSRFSGSETRPPAAVSIPRHPLCGVVGGYVCKQERFPFFSLFHRILSFNPRL